MEELLNKLIEKGWRPRWKNYGVIDFLGALVFVDLNDWRLSSKNALDLRKLVSKESWLWQFVCENWFVPKDERVSRRKIDEDWNYINHYSKYREKWSDVEYRLIESALCDEDELEQFLLDNIKIEWK